MWSQMRTLLLGGCLGVLLTLALLPGTPTENVDSTVPAPVVKTLAQIRCAFHVYEDGSAVPEDGDRARDECYYRMTGEHLFVNWRDLRD